MERGGKLSRGALAQRLGLPPIRLGGFLTAARRLLNVDQERVLSMDEASDTVALDRAVLEAQFRIGRP
jgi:ParB-like chromosome segregation protein Spo0J